MIFVREVMPFKGTSVFLIKGITHLRVIESRLLRRKFRPKRG
jgi:hypothetical protein